MEFAKFLQSQPVATYTVFVFYWSGAISKQIIFLRIGLFASFNI